VKARSRFGFATLYLGFRPPLSPVERLLVLTVSYDAFLVLLVDPCDQFDALDGILSSAEPSGDEEGGLLIAGF
jgi:hypothetical protein